MFVTTTTGVNGRAIVRGQASRTRRPDRCDKITCMERASADSGTDVIRRRG